MWVPAKKEARKVASNVEAKEAALKYKHRPLEEDAMDVGLVDDKCEAFFVRQEC